MNPRHLWTDITDYASVDYIPKKSEKKNLKVLKEVSKTVKKVQKNYKKIPKKI